MNLTNSVRTAFKEMGGERGFFADPSNPTNYFAFNPSEAIWQNPKASPTEIMAYSAERVHPRKGKPYYVGITFGGQRTNLPALPDWKPLPMPPR
jgi:hypothetical protein